MRPMLGAQGEAPSVLCYLCQSNYQPACISILAASRNLENTPFCSCKCSIDRSLPSLIFAHLSKHQIFRHAFTNPTKVSRIMFKGLHLLGLLSLVTSIAIPSDGDGVYPYPDDNNKPKPPPGPYATTIGSCPSAGYSTEEEFVAGYQSYCDNYISETSAHPIGQNNPLRATFNLTNADKSMSRWVYKISLKNAGKGETSDIDRATCKSKFQAFLDDNSGPNTGQDGGLGRSYCVVDGTGGDRKDGKIAQSGQGTVCMLGTGKTWINGLGMNKKVTMVFESYPRLDSTGGSSTDCGNILC
jgi:hypothetical protein